MVCPGVPLILVLIGFPPEGKLAPAGTDGKSLGLLNTEAYCPTL